MILNLLTTGYGLLEYRWKPAKYYDEPIDTTNVLYIPLLPGCPLAAA
jgi:hypothetical protein